MTRPLCRSHFRVLLAVYQLYLNRTPITQRRLARLTASGTSNAYVRAALCELRRRGLVAFEDRRGATIRPTLQFVVVRAKR
jgi:DNA-binding GntR family transcriptional regulator